MPAKRKIFVSYNRSSDQEYFDRFCTAFSDIYDIIRDDIQAGGSCSEKPEEALPRLRKEFIGVACCAVVLCGAETASDVSVALAVKAALDERRALIAVNLPNSRADSLGRVQVPEQLHKNIVSGYAMWLEWTRLLESPLSMGAYIEIAGRNARKPDLAINDELPMPLASA